MHQQPSYSKQLSPFDLNQQSSFARSPFDPTSPFDPLVIQWGRTASSHGRKIDELDLIQAQNLIDSDPKVREALAKSLVSAEKNTGLDDSTANQSTQAKEEENALNGNAPESKTAGIPAEKDESSADSAGLIGTNPDIFSLKLPSYSYQWFSPKNPDYYMQKESTATSQSQVTRPDSSSNELNG